MPNLPVMLFAAAIGLAIYMVTKEASSMGEITWKEFVSKYLSAGGVQRLEVVEQGVGSRAPQPERRARTPMPTVNTRTSTRIDVTHTYTYEYRVCERLVPLADRPRPWFLIGGVEALERNLEAAQTELQIASANHVDVIYKQTGFLSTFRP